MSGKMSLFSWPPALNNAGIDLSTMDLSSVPNYMTMLHNCNKLSKVSFKNNPSPIFWQKLHPRICDFSSLSSKNPTGVRQASMSVGITILRYKIEKGLRAVQLEYYIKKFDIINQSMLCFFPIPHSENLK